MDSSHITSKLEEPSYPTPSLAYPIHSIHRIKKKKGKSCRVREWKSNRTLASRTATATIGTLLPLPSFVEVHAMKGNWKLCLLVAFGSLLVAFGSLLALVVVVVMMRSAVPLCNSHPFSSCPTMPSHASVFDSKLRWRDDHAPSTPFLSPQKEICYALLCSIHPVFCCTKSNIENR